MLETQKTHHLANRDPQRLYRGIVPTPDSQHVALVEHGNTKQLPWRTETVNHSPTGLSWGYGGSGPSQCALAILIDAVGVSRALAFYQAFKWQCIAMLPIDEPWEMPVGNVIAWVERAEHDALR